MTFARGRGTRVTSRRCARDGKQNAKRKRESGINEDTSLRQLRTYDARARPHARLSENANIFSRRIETCKCFISSVSRNTHTTEKRRCYISRKRIVSHFSSSKIVLKANRSRCNRYQNEANVDTSLSIAYFSQRSLAN